MIKKCRVLKFNILTSFIVTNFFLFFHKRKKWMEKLTFLLNIKSAAFHLC